MEIWKRKDKGDKMPKFNKKGMTSVELLVCFIIVSTIVVSMYNLIMNYRNREQIEEVNNEVISFTNNLQKDIQDDLIKGHLTSVTNLSSDGYSAIFTFDTPESYQTILNIDPDTGVISYGMVGNTIDYKLPTIPELTLDPESKIEYTEAVNGYLKISIIINHPNFEDGQEIYTITCPINFVY